jgi:hypothetical protein
MCWSWIYIGVNNVKWQHYCLKETLSVHHMICHMSIHFYENKSVKNHQENCFLRYSKSMLKKINSRIVCTRIFVISRLRPCWLQLMHAFCRQLFFLQYLYWFPIITDWCLLLPLPKEAWPSSFCQRTICFSAWGGRWLNLCWNHMPPWSVMFLLITLFSFVMLYQSIVNLILYCSYQVRFCDVETVRKEFFTEAAVPPDFQS